jgi:hypothetical protein
MDGVGAVEHGATLDGVVRVVDDRQGDPPSMGMTWHPWA